jgi:FkbM family methyltransferase
MIITYAQNFEDVLLNRVFQGKRSGFYIDVGAHDPEDMSVTKHFYDLGWSGINIEPVPESYARFVAKRPRDVNLKMALGARFEFRTIHIVSGQTPYVADCAALSSLDPKTASEAADLVGAQPIREVRVEVRTLAEICRTYCNQPIDFLKIDVEGWERQVLEGADFQTYRPVVLVVEALKPNASISDPSAIAAYAAWTGWEDIVLKAGYLFAYFDGLNRFYVRQEDKHLLGMFTLPVGVYDDVQFTDPRRMSPSLRIRVADENPRLKEALASAEDSRRDSAKRQVLVDRLTRQRDRLDARLKETLVAIRGAGKEVKKRHAFVVRLVRERDRLKARLKDTLASVKGARQESKRRQAVTNRLLKERDRLNGRLKKTLALVREARRETAKRQALVDNRSRERSRLEARLDEALASIEESWKENLERQALVNRLVQERVRLEDRTRELEEDGARVKSQLDVLHAENEWRGLELNRLESAVTDLSQKNADLERRARTIATRQLELETENAGVREVAQAFEAWGENVRRQGERLVAAQAEWRRENQTLQDERLKLSAENSRLAAEASALRGRLELIQTVIRERDFRARNRVWLTIQRYLPMVTLLVRRKRRPALPPTVSFETASWPVEQQRIRPNGSEVTLADQTSWPEKPASRPSRADVAKTPRPNGWIMAPSGKSLADQSPGYWRELLPVIQKAGENGPVELFDPFLEQTLTSAGEAGPRNGGWAGITQFGPSIPEWIAAVASQKQLASAAQLQIASWGARRDSCRGLVAMSDYQAAYLRKNAGVRVIVVRPPLPLGRPEWSWDRFTSDGRRRIIQPDERLQRSHGLHMLEVAEAEKSWWRSPLLAPDDLVETERAELMRDYRLLSYMLPTVTCEPPPSGTARADLLRESLVFAHLYDAIAPGILFECIASATPILINAIPAVREYLGSGYPLYYFSYLDAAEKAADDLLIKRSHEYLKTLPQRRDLTKEAFLRELATL